MTQNFDFRPIAEKYPKSFELLKEWIYDYNKNHFSGIALSGDDGAIGLYLLKGGYEWLNPLELSFFL